MTPRRCPVFGLTPYRVLGATIEEHVIGFIISATVTLMIANLIEVLTGQYPLAMTFYLAIGGMIAIGLVRALIRRVSQSKRRKELPRLLTQWAHKHHGQPLGVMLARAGSLYWTNGALPPLPDTTRLYGP